MESMQNFIHFTTFINFAALVFYFCGYGFFSIFFLLIIDLSDEINLFLFYLIEIIVRMFYLSLNLLFKKTRGCKFRENLTIHNSVSYFE